jgi:hypothetical protein
VAFLGFVPLILVGLMYVWFLGLSAKWTLKMKIGLKLRWIYFCLVIAIAFVNALVSHAIGRTGSVVLGLVAQIAFGAWFFGRFAVRSAVWPVSERSEDCGNSHGAYAPRDRVNIHGHVPGGSTSIRRLTVPLNRSFDTDTHRQSAARGAVSLRPTALYRCVPVNSDARSHDERRIIHHS